MAGKRWTKEELVLALNLYLKLPFGKMHRSTSEVIDLAAMLGRTPSSIAMRLSNFASVDPYHQNRGVAGLPGGRKQVEPIWNEFVKDREAFLFESERLLAGIEQKSLEEKYGDLLLETEGLVGEAKRREVETRVNQSVFRRMILTDYSGKCAVSGIDIDSLLVASHIIPWAKNKKQRLNPENGICLSALYDRAFDRGLIGFKKDYSVILSESLKRKRSTPYYQQYFSHLEKKTLDLPSRYWPRKDFLEFHLDTVFQG